MNIVIMRHGEAEAFVSRDADRTLTDVGHQQAKLAGECLSQLGLCFDQVWVSPYIRAQQTATAVLSSFAETSSSTLELLTPDSSPALVVDKLEQSRLDSLLIVSHQPLVSTLVGLLGHADPRAGPPMSPASMALLWADVVLPGCCDLQWLRHAPIFDRV
ncbi:MAG: phosphohistidine phosphatase SixA [Pseudomonadales bacterium]